MTFYIFSWRLTDEQTATTLYTFSRFSNEQSLCDKQSSSSGADEQIAIKLFGKTFTAARDLKRLTLKKKNPAKTFSKRCGFLCFFSKIQND